MVPQRISLHSREKVDSFLLAANNFLSADKTLDNARFLSILEMSPSISIDIREYKFLETIDCFIRLSQHMIEDRQSKKPTISSKTKSLSDSKTKIYFKNLKVSYPITDNIIQSLIPLFEMDNIQTIDLDLDSSYLKYLAESTTDLSSNHQHKYLDKVRRIAVKNRDYDDMDFYKTIIDPDLIKFLSRFKNLEEIDLSFCDGFPDSPILEDVDLNKVKKIDLSTVPLNGARLKELLSRCSNLEEIKLFSCSKISDLPSLEDVDLSKIKKIDLSRSAITGTGLKNLLSKCNNLEEINLSWCSKISDLPNLEDLDLSKVKKINLSISKITETGLKNLLSKCENLEEIDLSMCKNLSSNVRDHKGDVDSLKRFMLVPPPPLPNLQDELSDTPPPSQVHKTTVSKLSDEKSSKEEGAPEVKGSR